MDLELTDEQTWLAESVGTLLAKSSGPEAWDALVEFGALSIGKDAEGLGAVELALIARALGERLETVPFIPSAAARYAAGELAIPDDAAIALCLLEPELGWELEHPTTVLDHHEANGRARLDGEKIPVEHAARADALLVLAADDDGRRLALVPPDQPGVAITPVPSIDGALPIESVTFTAATASPGGALSAEATEPVLERLRAIGGVLAAAEAVGAASTVLSLAREYAGERRQFGRTIGSFQALRHLLADLYVNETSAWSTVLFAAAALEDDIDDALRTARVAKAYASRATLAVAHGALQVFGGIAFTDEHPSHRYLRRIIVRGRDFGDARHHERAIGRALARADRLQEVIA
jgi:alkylation response protein AidB-like acyl-CoA dehydrogenase